MRLRILLIAFVAVSAAVLVALAATRGGEDGEPRRLAPGRGFTESTADPLAYGDDRREDFERRAAAGLSHVLYVKSPGGVVATAHRVDRFRALVEGAARQADVEPDLLEALVFLESAGRPDARASDDLEGAAGLTQILAETGRNLLRMRVDVRASERLTRGIARGRRVRAREAARRRVDERFDPRKALAGTARYLRFAKERLGRDDLAFQSYHMGVGNLQRALSAYGDEDIPYARLYFDSTPLRHAAAWQILAALGDDSSTYLWRLYAAREIMRLWRRSPAGLATRALLHAAKNSGEEVLHPRGSTPVYEDGEQIAQAREERVLVPLATRSLRAHGLRIHPRLGEFARRVRQPASLYRALRPEAQALLHYMGAGVREIAGTAPLSITSAVRDQRYQDALVGRNREATRGYSLHTTGFAFDISRRYRSRAQALAFQFWLDRLAALDLIAWVREPGAIHVTVSARARELAGALPRPAATQP